MNRRTGLETGTEILRHICRLIEGENRYADMENPHHPPLRTTYFREALGPTLSPQAAGLRDATCHHVRDPGTKQDLQEKLQWFQSVVKGLHQPPPNTHAMSYQTGSPPALLLIWVDVLKHF